MHTTKWVSSRQTGKVSDLKGPLNAVADKGFLAEDDLRVATFGGKVIILPVQRVQMALGVRKSWLDKVGETFPATWADVQRVAVKFRDGDPDGNGKASEAFLAWQKFASESPVFPIGGIVNGGSATDLAADVIAAYDAPFPDDSYTAGARIFPSMVPNLADQAEVPENRAAWQVLEQFTRPWLCAFSDSDPITKGGESPFMRRIPGAQGQPHTTIVGGGHFLQEDKGPELAEVILRFIDGTRETVA